MYGFILALAKRKALPTIEFNTKATNGVAPLTDEESAKMRQIYESGDLFIGKFEIDAENYCATVTTPMSRMDADICGFFAMVANGAVSIVYMEDIDKWFIVFEVANT